MSEIVLEIKDLTVEFVTDEGVLPGVEGVNLVLHQGETLAIAGESGCGKSVTAMSILKLIPSPPSRVVKGEIIYGGEDLLPKTLAEMCDYRGQEIAMIFQEPMTALNPVLTIETQLCEPLILHRGMNKLEAKERALEMIKEVGIPDAERFIVKYPHQLSGGMRQRVMIAMALACDPNILIADEPTTALDVTVQAQVLRLLEEMQAKTNAAIMLITHDMGVVAQMADKVMIMYAGRVVEYGDVFDLFANPSHPYTVGLLDSIPSMAKRKDRLFNIEGTVPSPREYAEGCRFHPRCPYAMEKCINELPPQRQVGAEHYCSCWKLEGEFGGE